MADIKSINKFKEWKSRWSEQDSLGFLDYVSFNIHPEDILIIGNLFFPDFIEVDGYIFLEMNFDAETYKKISADSSDKPAIEQTINRIRVYDLFAHTDNMDTLTCLRVGQLLKFAWSLNLNNKFPDKEITVELIVNKYEYGPVLTLYRK